MMAPAKRTIQIAMEDHINDYIQVEKAENKTKEDGDVEADQPWPFLQYSWQSARPVHVKCT